VATKGDEWITLREASVRTGFVKETIRLWTKGDRPAVRHRERSVGRTVVFEVAVADVDERASVSDLRRAHRAPDAIISSSDHPEAGLVGDLLDRATVLEELVRRRHVIDDHRDVIEEHQAAIIREQRAIEQLLLGPSRVPTN
jgi:hypothetical protein